MKREGSGGVGVGQSWTFSPLSEFTADEQGTFRLFVRRLCRDARFWLTIAAMALGTGVLAAAIVWQSERAAAHLRAANGWYAHTLEVLVEAGRLTTALSETQRGARGYLLTGDPQFLPSYKAGVQATPDTLHRIRVLTADNPVQQKRLAALALNAASVVSLSERMVGLEAEGHHAAALAIVQGGTAHTAMGRALATGSALVAEEQRLLTVRRAAAEEATSQVTRNTVALGLLGAVLLFAAVGMGSAAFAAAARARDHERQAALGALLSLFIDGAPAAIAMFDRQMRYLAASRRYVADYRLPAGIALVGRSHFEIFPELSQRWRDIHARVLAGATESCEDDSLLRADGRLDWVRWRMEPWRDPQGEVGGALLFSEVITAQVESRREQLAAEARLRAIVETAADAIVVIDEAGVIQSVNPATEAMFGYSAEELIGRNVSLLMPEPWHSAHDGYLAAYLKTGERKVIGVGREVEGLRKDGSILPVDLAVAEWRVEGRRYFTGQLRDISARKMADAQRLQAERRELVVGELRHRINNMFAVIQSLVVLTARSHHDVGTYIRALQTRINAFATTQVELARQAWSSMDLRELVNFELKPYSEAGQQVSVQGEALSVNSAAAESLAMVVHELATNSAKYGALSTPGATLDVRWRLISDRTGELRLVFEWIERGGPPVLPPQRRGFGSIVIESSARTLGGAAQLNYGPEGLYCTIDMPAARVRVRCKAPLSQTAEMTGS